MLKRGWFVLVLSLSSAFAQESATLSGLIKDPNRDPVCNATVTAVHAATNRTWEVKSSHEGDFRVLALPPGEYRVSVRMEGFREAQREVNLHAGQALEIVVPLALADVRQSMDVVADAPAVELERTQAIGRVVPAEIDALPLNGRNYLDLALLVPGVSRTNLGVNQRFAETSAVPGTGLSVAGQRNLNNSFVVDGMSANDDAADLAGSFYSEEVIREFQVVTSSASAEFGRASGGAVSVVTRSGSNQWRGRLYDFFRNQRLDARNPLFARKDPLTKSQYGASLGGPVVRDRAFVFTNFEQTRENAAGVVTIAPAAADAINARRPEARVATGEFPTALRATNYFARLDRGPLAIRYNLYDLASTNARTIGGLNATSRGSALDNRDQTFAATDLRALSPRAILENRVQYTRSRLAAPLNDPLGPAVNISGVANFGAATSSPTGRTNDLVEGATTISRVAGTHTFKAGVDLLYNRLNIQFPGAMQGVYTFSSLPNFLAGRYVTYQQAFGRAGQFQSNPNFGGFAQDEWRVHPRVVLDLGARYDVQSLAAPIRTDTNNFAPRAGVAVSPAPGTVVRAGFGLYYDRVPLRAVSNALQRDGVDYRLAVLSFGQGGAPQFPNVMRAFPDGLLTSITTIDPGIRPSYSVQSSFQVDRELGRHTSLSAGYMYLRGIHLIVSRNVNAPALAATDAARLGIPNLGRPDPRWGNVSRYEGAADSYYHGLTVAFGSRLARVSYTFSKAIDNAGNYFFSTPQDANDLRGERGLSDNDQRHRLAASGTVRGPAGLELGYIFSYNSALPYNVTTGTDRNNDTTVNDRPAGLGRNTGRGFNFASLDVRVSRAFHLGERRSVQALAESFNSTNRANWAAPNGVVGPNLGRPTAAGDPRQMQLGLRFDF